jgi:hypothetical protein
MKHRIQYNIIIFLWVATFLSGCAVTDTRLSGKWRSNLELTTQYNEKHAILTEKQKKVFSQLFGQMELTYISSGKCEVFLPGGKIDTGSKVIDSEDFKYISEYKIIYKNEKAIVVLSEDSVSGESIRTLNFVDDNTYWVYIGDSGMFDIHIREYFTKVK